MKKTPLEHVLSRFDKKAKAEDVKPVKDAPKKRFTIRKPKVK